ncbi:hypothetical protein NKH77_31090 [Streptomyces sp. M19]
MPLIDLRPDAEGNDEGHPLLTSPTAHVPAAEANGTTNFNALTDERLARHLAATDADVVVATRPAWWSASPRSAPTAICGSARSTGCTRPTSRRSAPPATRPSPGSTRSPPSRRPTRRPTAATCRTSPPCCARCPTACPPRRSNPPTARPSWWSPRAG